MPTIEIHDLVVDYPGREHAVRALDGVTARIEDGQLALLLGPSGCGKTTLLSCLGGILRPTSGSVEVDGRGVDWDDEQTLLAFRRRTVGFVFQSFNLVASLSALDNVAAPLRTAGVRAAPARERARVLLELVGLTQRSQHRPGELSGGQQQRVAIARGLAHDPPVLLADEPTANLDVAQVESVLTILRELASPGRCVVVSTHDDRLLPLADHVIDLRTHLDETVRGGTRQLRAGETLFAAGDPSDVVYVVESGHLEILVDEGDDGSLAVVAERGPGAYVGELGPMMGQPRSATVRAATDTVVIGMSVQEFRARRLEAVTRCEARAPIPSAPTVGAVAEATRVVRPSGAR